MDIPSESSIQAAKQKRERLRTSQTSGNDDGFISLSVTRKDEHYRGPHPESRLVREEDELGEGDDGELSGFLVLSPFLFVVEFAEYTSAQERVALGKKAKRKEAEKRKSTMQELINDAYVKSGGDTIRD